MYEYIVIENHVAYSKVLTYKNPNGAGTVNLVPLVHMAEQSYYDQLLDIFENKPVLLEVILLQDKAMHELNKAIFDSPSIEAANALLREFTFFSKNSAAINSFFDEGISLDLKDLFDKMMNISQDAKNEELHQLLNACKITGFDSICNVLLQRFAAEILGAQYSMKGLSDFVSIIDKGSQGWVFVPLSLGQPIEQIIISPSEQTYANLNQLAAQLMPDLAFFAEFLNLSSINDRRKKYIDFLKTLRDIIQANANDVINNFTDVLNYLRQQIQQGIQADIQFSVATGALNLAAMEDVANRLGWVKAGEQKIKIIDFQ
jgi:hypothetical protein